jgi:HK97 gp10 family phage protein
MEQVVRDVQGPPMINAARDATLLVTGDAKRNVPPRVDTSRMRASIAPEIRTGAAGGTVVQGVVGSNVKYAPYQELGTRYITPHRFFRRAVEGNLNRIRRLFERAAELIARK